MGSLLLSPSAGVESSNGFRRVPIQPMELSHQLGGVSRQRQAGEVAVDQSRIEAPTGVRVGGDIFVVPIRRAAR